jgi:hypothetical protein
MLFPAMKTNTIMGFKGVRLAAMLLLASFLCSCAGTYRRVDRRDDRRDLRYERRSDRVDRWY